MLSKLLREQQERWLLQKRPQLTENLLTFYLHTFLPNAALGCPSGQREQRGQRQLLRGRLGSRGRGEPAPGCMRGSGPALRLCRRGAGGGRRAKSEHSQARMFWQPFLAD